MERQQFFWSFLFFLVSLAYVSCWEFRQPGANDPCVSISGSIVLKISYNKTVDNDIKIAVLEVPVPKNITEDASLLIDGQCLSGDQTDTSKVYIKWGNFTLNFRFLKDSVKELWYASPTNLTYDERNFDGSYNPKSERTARTSAELFSTRESHKYQCNAKKSYQLFDVIDDKETSNKTVDLISSKLLIAPFEKLLDASKCTEDEQPTEPTHKPTPKPPVKPTTKEPGPKPEPASSGPSGSKVAWICTFLSIGILSISAAVIYAKRNAPPDYLRV